MDVTVRAQLTRVTRAEVERVLASRPDLAFHLIQRMAQRVRTLAHTVSRLASVDVYGRLVGLFDVLAGSGPAEGSGVLIPWRRARARVTHHRGGRDRGRAARARRTRVASIRAGESPEPARTHQRGGSFFSSTMRVRDTSM